MNNCSPMDALEHLQSMSVVHCEETWSSDILQNINEMRQSRELCDLTIDVGGVDFPCHRVLLAAVCPYFRALFRHSRQSLDRTSLLVEGIRTSGFSRILDFFYTSKLTITVSNAMEIFETADFLQLSGVVASCASLLVHYVNSGNALALELFARAHQRRDLASVAHEYIVTHLLDVAAHSIEFSQLPASDCRQYVLESRMQLRLPEEQDELSHHQLPFRMMEHVTPPIDDAEFEDLSALAECRPTDVLVVIPAEVIDVDTSSVFYLDPNPQATWKVLTLLPFTQRAHFVTVAVKTSMLFLSGGVDVPNSQNTGNKAAQLFDDVYLYSVDEQGDAAWQRRAPMLNRRSNHSASECFDHVYVFGGFVAGNSFQHDAEVYDVLADQWTSLPHRPSIPVHVANPLSWIRCAAVALGETIYVFGGSTLHNKWMLEAQTLRAQMLNVQHSSHQWSSCPLLEAQLQRSVFEIGRGNALAWRGFIVLIDFFARQQVQLLDPITGEITDLLPTVLGQHHHGGFAIADDVLYCTGGLAKGEQSDHNKCVHWTNLTSRAPVQWHITAPLPRALSHHSCVILTKQL